VRNLKKFLLGLTCGIALTATTAVYAADPIKAYLFPAKFSFNGKVTELSSDEYVILNHNGHAYVPIRFVAETMGTAVSYNDSKQTIFVNSKDYLLNVENLKVRLLNKSTKAEVLDVLGDKYTDLGSPPMEGGVQYPDIKLWRYDFGVADGYTVPELKGHEGWSDVEGVQSGKVGMQVLVRWDNEKLEGYIITFKGPGVEPTYYVSP
jgi:hypothetical protein